MVLLAIHDNTIHVEDNCLARSHTQGRTIRGARGESTRKAKGECGRGGMPGCAGLKLEVRGPKPETNSKCEGRRSETVPRPAGFELLALSASWVCFGFQIPGFESYTEGSAAYATPKAAEPSPSPLQKGRGLGRGVPQCRLSRGLGSK